VAVRLTAAVYADACAQARFHTAAGCLSMSHSLTAPDVLALLLPLPPAQSFPSAPPPRRHKSIRPFHARGREEGLHGPLVLYVYACALTLGRTGAGCGCWWRVVAGAE
jgi:hypothetical protein